VDGRKKVTFYDIGLACEAAPHIACGIRAKPILASLEASSLVCNAWFSRSGTALAIEWAATDLSPDQEIDVIRSALGGEAAVATRIVDVAAVEELHRSFADRRAWYRKDDLDELSEEESWVIASRLVQRMLTTIDLGAQRQEAVRRVVAHASAGVLTTVEPGTPATREKLLGDAILNAACCELEPAEVEALKQAIARGGHRPVAGEE
jgi:hypothetical protein